MARAHVGARLTGEVRRHRALEAGVSYALSGWEFLPSAAGIIMSIAVLLAGRPGLLTTGNFADALPNGGVMAGLIGLALFVPQTGWQIIAWLGLVRPNYRQSRKTLAVLGAGWWAGVAVLWAYLGAWFAGTGISLLMAASLSVGARTVILYAGRPLSERLRRGD